MPIHFVIFLFVVAASVALAAVYAAHQKRMRGSDVRVPDTRYIKSTQQEVSRVLESRKRLASAEGSISVRVSTLGEVVPEVGREHERVINSASIRTFLQVREDSEATAGEYLQNQ